MTRMVTMTNFAQAMQNLKKKKINVKTKMFQNSKAANKYEMYPTQDIWKNSGVLDLNGNSYWCLLCGASLIQN